MKAVDLPTRFPIAFGASAGGAYIRAVPTDSQIGIQDGAASLETGFPPLNFLPVGAGGVPPFGQDMNGILNQITGWSRWQSAGGPVPYDSAFSADVGGYPAGAFVASAITAGLAWFSTTDDNVTDPDAGGAGWVPFRFQPTARIVTASGAFTIGLTDQSIGLNRTSSVAVSNAPLPDSAYVGYQVAVEDLAANFAQFPVTITPPSGQTLAGIGAGGVVLRINRQCASFRYYGSNIWSVRL